MQLNEYSSQNFSVTYYNMLTHALGDTSSFRDSRTGPVKDLGPAYFEIKHVGFPLPVLRARAINPFFALTEFSWLLTGCNKLQPLQNFIKNYGMYSDDNQTLNGAYGYRLRTYFGRDQVHDAIQELKNNPDSRRVVLSMWSVDDLGSSSKDVPCNISILLKMRNKKLDFTVINRSNDLYLGVPYNVFTFYLFHEFLALQIGCTTGIQRHFTDSLHLYQRDVVKIEKIIKLNSVEYINNIFKTIPGINVGDYIKENHDLILQQKYDFPTGNGFSQLFEAYRHYNAGNLDKIGSSLPRNILGLTAYLWFIDRLNMDIHVGDFDVILRDSCI